MPLTGKILASLSLTETKSAVDFATPSFAINQQYVWDIVSGTGVGQSDLLFADQRTLSAGANEDLDLAGVLASVYGATLTFVKLRALWISAAAANPNNITVTRPASNGVPLFAAASDAIALEPGAGFLYVSKSSGKTVTAATGDLINVLAGAGGNHVYDVFVIGTSA